MRDKENKIPLNSQLNRTLGNLTALTKNFKNGEEMHPMVIQMRAVRGGVKKINEKLLKDYIITEIKAIIKALLASGKYDQTHCNCFIHIESDLKNHTIVKQAKMYDILHKNFPWI